MDFILQDPYKIPCNFVLVKFIDKDDNHGIRTDHIKSARYPDASR